MRSPSARRSGAKEANALVVSVKSANQKKEFNFSGTSFRRFRRTRLEGRVFLPARRWCLELGRASGGTAGAHPQLRSRCRRRISVVTQFDVV